SCFSLCAKVTKKRKAKVLKWMSLNDVYDMLETSYIHTYHAHYFGATKDFAIIALESFGKKPRVILGPITGMKRLEFSPQEISRIMETSNARMELAPRVIHIMLFGCIEKFQPVTLGGAIDHVRIVYKGDHAVEEVWLKVSYKENDFSFVIEPRFH
ncbi:MAG: hypothetical protein LRY41_03655, partial [Candidatus Pacebacteria bacterium]|nr:hypothetical protein [Candidatus Paceibacterota bacterium]